MSSGQGAHSRVVMP